MAIMQHFGGSWHMLHYGACNSTMCGLKLLEAFGRTTFSVTVLFDHRLFCVL